MTHGAAWKFLEYVDVDDGCWGWRASLISVGYAQFMAGGRKISGHRFAYELLRGPIPEGLHIDHLCRNRGCVNPWHMEVVTPGENVRRGMSSETHRARHAAKTHCAHGHELSGENVAIYYSEGWLRRRCRICQRALARRAYTKGRGIALDREREEGAA